MSLLSVLIAAPALGKPKSAQTPAERSAQEHSALAANALKAGDTETAVRELKTAQGLAPSADIAIDLSRALVLSGDVLQAREVLTGFLASGDKTLGSKRGALEAERSRVQARIAVLKLEIAEPGASVKLDDKDLGTTPLLTAVESNPGSHALVVGKEGFTPVTRQLDLRAGSNPVSIELVREKLTGHLSVSLAAEDTFELFVNEKSAGTLPLELDLPPGDYKLLAKGHKMASNEQTVRVALGQTTSVGLTAALLPGEADVNAGAAEAVIYIDDVKVGSGQWHGPLSAGSHQLRLERPGYSPYHQALEIGPGERVVVGQISYVGLPRAQPVDEEAAYQGIFVNVALLGFFGSGSTNSIAEDCAANASGGNCSSTRPIGGGLGVRVGYSFGWVALEGLVLGAADASTATANYEFGTSAATGSYYGVPRQEHYAFVRYGYGLGVGARVTSSDAFLRVTGGIDGTLLFRTSQYTRETTANTAIPDADTHTSDAEHYVSPGLMADIGVMLGSTPGAKFHVGLAVLVEFPPDPVTTPGVTKTLGHYTSSKAEPYGTPPIDLSRGPQVFLGPFLAVQFGH